MSVCRVVVDFLHLRSNVHYLPGAATIIRGQFSMLLCVHKRACACGLPVLPVLLFSNFNEMCFWILWYRKDFLENNNRDDLTDISANKETLSSIPPYPDFEHSVFFVFNRCICEVTPKFVRFYYWIYCLQDQSVPSNLILKTQFHCLRYDTFYFWRTKWHSATCSVFSFTH